MTSILQSDDIFGIDDLKGSGAPVRVPLTRKEKLQSELKLLEWHKMANEAAIKSALLQTKGLKDINPTGKTLTSTTASKLDTHDTDERWIKKVIQQEHIKPLEVSKEYVLEYEKREQENADRLSNQVDRHIQTLKNLRVKLEARNDLKQRQEEYRTWQKDFQPKKQAIMIGKTLEEYSSSMISPTTKDDLEDREINDELMANYYQTQKDKQSNNPSNRQSTQELSNVLDSLNKLAELEKRISSLEKENKYDELVALESPTANQRTAFEFRKKRTPMNSNNPKESGPVGMVYEIKTKGKTSTQPMGRGVPTGNGIAAVRAKQQQQPQRNSGYANNDEDYEDDGHTGAGVFITTQASTDRMDRETLRRERMRNQALAPAGQKSLKNRVQDRKSRMKEQMIGAKKHEDAMKEMVRRKQEQSTRKMGIAAASRNTKAPLPPAKGIAAGLKNKNKHLQEFEKMKNGFRKRKEDVEKNFVPKSGIEKRLQSQTVPAYRSAHPSNKPIRGSVNNRLSSNNNGRVPVTKTGGMITRKAQQLPTTRRGGGNGPSNSLAPPQVAVTGMGGLRVIRAGLANKR